MNWTQKKKIILASKSPRRAELLTLMDIPFIIKTKESDESYPDHLKGNEIPMFIAKEKATLVKNFYQLHDEIILAADSIVVLQDEILEKPIDEKDTYRMLAKLSGKKHSVITGVCILDGDNSIVFASKSNVLMRPLDHDEIVYYINKYNPLDKAGGYGIQEWIGTNKISHIEGTYTNIMGLPTDLVYEALKSIMC